MASILATADEGACGLGGASADLCGEYLPGISLPQDAWKASSPFISLGGSRHGCGELFAAVGGQSDCLTRRGLGEASRMVVTKHHMHFKVRCLSVRRSDN